MSKCNSSAGKMGRRKEGRRRSSQPGRILGATRIQRRAAMRRGMNLMMMEMTKAGAVRRTMRRRMRRMRTRTRRKIIIMVR